VPARPRRLLAVGPRPAGERWCGKNWPASQAAALEWPPGDPSEQWLLFIDADVRLEAAALGAALQAVAAGGQDGPPVDLLTLAPRLDCGCLAEWLVQPIVASLLGLGFPLKRSNDPADPTAFAAGPFMLFRRSAYEAIGGHRAVAGEVVEDLALAKAIKSSGHRLLYLLGIDLVRLRMYQDLPVPLGRVDQKLVSRR
jgi:cellulose synthase/poly-beta-1,6-N-acetylglucosamine synthase-like glycosyltransferase